MTPGLISVIIPVFNTVEFLPECLDSVLAQSYLNLQIICIDDGSTDGSQNILQEYKQRDDRIILVTQNNRGASAAKNRGLDIATGEFLAIVDSDDRLMPEAFLNLHGAIMSYRLDIAHGSFTCLSYYSGRKKHFADQRILTGMQKVKALLEHDIHHDPWAKLYRRSLFSENNLRYEEDIHYSTDFLMVYQLFHFANSVKGIPDEVYEKKNLRPDSLTYNLKSDKYVSDRIQVRSRVADFLKSKNVWEIHKKNFRKHNKWFFEIILVNHVIFQLKGTSCRSFNSIIGLCRAGLPEFCLVEEDILRNIIRSYTSHSGVILRFLPEDRRRINEYIGEYLVTVPIDELKLSPSEKRLVQQNGKALFRRASNIFLVFYYRTCNLEIWKSRFSRLNRQSANMNISIWRMFLIWLGSNARRYWDLWRQQDSGQRGTQRKQVM